MILGYSRVSTVEQAADGTTSLSEQERRCRGAVLARGASTYDFVMYSDPGVSGSIPLAERPAGAKLLEDAAKGDIIVASKLDRLFRSAADAQVTVEFLRKRGVDVILIDMGIEPVTSSGTSKLFFGMLAVFAEFERMRIGERMAEGRRAKKERGGHLGGEAPYGYRIEGEGRMSKLVPDAKEQEIIQVVKDQLKHRRPRKIVSRVLRKMGYRSRAGTKFEVTQVQRLMESARGQSPRSS